MLNEYLRPPKQQRFWRVLAFSMHIISIIDCRWWGYKAPNKLIYLIRFLFDYFTPVALVSQIYYVYINFNNISLYNLESILIIVCITILVNVKVRSSKTRSYEKAMKDFWNEIHLYHHQSDYNLFTEKKLFSRERYTRLTTCTLGLFIFFDCALINAVCIYFNIANRELIDKKTEKFMTSVYLVMPFDYEYNYSNWLVMHCLNMYMYTLSAFLLTVSDSVCYAIIFHMIGHVEILKHKLRALSQDFEGLDERTVMKKIVELIEYHSFVTRSFKNIQAAFGMNVTGNYMFNLVIDSLILYQIMTREKVDAFIYVVMFLVFMGGLVVMSFILEEIRKQTDDLPKDVYDLPWEKMSVSNQKMVMLMLMRVQPVVSFIGAGGMKTGVQPMLGIIKSTFSYYVMLKQKV